MKNDLPKVKDAMSRNVFFLREDDFATKGRALFRNFEYRSMPVLDEDNKVIGIVTRGDILIITSTKSNIPVSGIMSTPRVLLTPEEDLLTAAKKMVDADVSSALVVKSTTDNTLVGIISLHDILPFLREKKSNKLARDIMTTEVVTCSPNDGVAKVWDKMEKTKFTGLPVVKNGKIVGIITRKDIIDAGFVRIRREDDKGKVKNSPKIEKIMKTPAICVSPDTSIKEIIDIILKHNIGRVPVTENKKLIGIIDREDIVRAFL